MTEQTRNITEAVIAKNQTDRQAQFKKQKALKQIGVMDQHLKRLRTLHLYGSTEKEVKAHKSDAYFSSWFSDALNGDIHAMHSILDHFEPLQMITNLGHNYRSRFATDAAEIILDFRPGNVIPRNAYSLQGVELNVRALNPEEREKIIKSYLYSAILRIAKELMMYFPLRKIEFKVNCNELPLQNNKFSVTDDQVKHFLKGDKNLLLNKDFEKMVLGEE